MMILVINSGSSSVKFTLFGAGDESALAQGIVERIGLSGTRLLYRNHRGQRREQAIAVAGADEAVEAIIAALTDAEIGVVKSLNDIAAVGHRVVHGGEALTRPVAVDAEVKAVISECARMAPLHNPPNLDGILACERHLPHALQVVVFDTAFHATLPPRAFVYGLPYRFYAEDGIRRYGFHGISHKYVAAEAARVVDRALAELRIITCHLGNGCSMTAVKGGSSVDTTMGFTPLEGLIMGTRCGDIDPAAVLHVMRHHRLDPAALNALLNTESGLKGLAGIGSSDLRDISAAAAAGNRQAGLAIEAFCYRIKKTIGAFAAAMGGLDVLVFTAGIGENAPEARAAACAGLDAPEGLGIALDPHRNADPAAFGGQIHAAGSRVKVLVIPTNEELEIVRETRRVLDGSA